MNLTSSTGYLTWLDKTNIVSAEIGTSNSKLLFFTVEELSAMRKASTPREKEAFVWFMETFIDCVVGKINCRKSKYLSTITNSIITISDEAFALLLFENYEEKWHAQHHHNCTKTEITSKMPRMHGKFTSKKVGQAEFGGWSSAGVSKFNANCRKIMEERNSDYGRHAEQELLAYLQSTTRGKNVLQKHLRLQSRQTTEDTSIVHEDAWHEL